VSSHGWQSCGGGAGLRSSACGLAAHTLRLVCERRGVMTNDEVVFSQEPSEDGLEINCYEFTIKNTLPQKRLDSYLAARFPHFSRTFVKKLIAESAITVNGRTVKPSHSPARGDRVLCRIPTVPSETVSPEDIPLDIIYEDQWLLVVNKPPDLVVHPSKGHQRGTLINALLYHCQKLSSEGGPLRPGIVHRLDRDTSGVMVVVKDESVHQELARQFHDREVTKEYLAICEGRIELDSDLIDAPLGPHLRDKEKVAVRHDVGKKASTTYEVVERLGDFTIVRCFPHTGRTHQIRVHLQHIGHPIVADPLYGHRDAIYLSELTGTESRPSEEPLLERQALHARRLTIYHPALRKKMTFEVEVPADMMRLIRALRNRESVTGGQ